MKIRVAAAGVCVLLFLMSSGIARSDQLTDLNAKIETLQQTIDAMKEEVKVLKEKQEKQKETVKAIRDNPSAAQVVEEALSKGITMGGHFKFFLADQSDGERNNENQNSNLAAGVNDLWLYFNKSITEWLSLEVAPKIEVLASATPGLGGNITRATSTSVDVDLDEAYMTLRLPYPYDVEFRAGQFYPFFSEEYASKNWWHEQYHGNNGLLTLENWQAAGVEIYKNFDFENFSLPVYFYPYLNGENRSQSNDSRFTDNNGDKNILIHVSPEAYVMGSRVRLLGSLGWGRWDDAGEKDSWQYALGADFTYRNISVISEFMRKEREEWPLSGGGYGDGDDQAWYVRAMYTFNPQWRALVKYSEAELFYPSETEMLTDTYKTLGIAVNYWLSEGSTIIPQIEYVDSERSDGSESLEYLRWTLGWRTTF